MGSYFSYAEQAGHYFGRPHEAPRLEPLGGPSAWRGPEMAERDDWRFQLDAAQVDEIREALARANATGKPTGELTAADFPLPRLADEIARWREEVQTGRGFPIQLYHVRHQRRLIVHMALMWQVSLQVMTLP